MLILLLAAAAVADVDAGRQALDLAIETLKASATSCAYTRVVTRKEETRVERFDPRGEGDGWSLVSIDGRPPDAKELRGYGKQSARRQQRDDPCDNDLEDLYEPGSLRLVERSASGWTLAFSPQADDEEEAKLLRHLEGKIVVREEGPAVSRIEMSNREPFSPVALATIKELQSVMEFSPVGDNGPHVVVRTHTRTKGSFMRFKKIDVDARIEFRDIELLD